MKIKSILSSLLTMVLMSGASWRAYSANRAERPGLCALATAQLVALRTSLSGSREPAKVVNHQVLFGDLRELGSNEIILAKNGRTYFVIARDENNFRAVIVDPLNGKFSSASTELRRLVEMKYDPKSNSIADHGFRNSVFSYQRLRGEIAFQFATALRESNVISMHDFQKIALEFRPQRIVPLARYL